MKKILTSILLTLFMVLALSSTVVFADTAIPSKTDFMMDGKPVSVANGTKIILWTEASDAGQTYIFEKIE